MATFFVSGDDSDGAVINGTEITFLVPDGVIVSNSNGPAVTFDLGASGDPVGTSNHLVIEGFVGSATFTAVDDIGEGGINNSVTVLETGMVFGTIQLDGPDVSTSIVTNFGAIDGGAVGVRLVGTSGRVVNAGTISGDTSGVILNGVSSSFDNTGQIFSGVSGVTLAGGNASFTNSGTIQANNIAARLIGDGGQFVNTGSILGGTAPTTEASGAYFEGDDIDIRNHGIISGEQNGIFVDGADGTVLNQGDVSGAKEYGIFLTNSDNVSLVNEGTALGGVGGISVGGNSAKVVNSGVASGLNGLLLQGDTGPLEVVNTGELIGSTGYGLFAGTVSLASVIVRNIGTISGQDRAIELGSGDDVVRNAGLIDGDVNLSLGNDLFREGPEGQTEGTVLGGGGMDTMTGGGERDVFSGGTENDSLRGNGGDDNLMGGDGNDFIDGGSGDDAISGGNDNDRLRGEAGDDVLRGDAGDDLMRADTGEDILFGGTGNDTMRGGQDADIFEFDPGDGLDRIIDFEDNLDTLDLTAYGFDDVAEVIALGRETPHGDVVLELNPGVDEIRIDSITLLALQDDILV